MSEIQTCKNAVYESLACTNNDIIGIIRVKSLHNSPKSPKKPSFFIDKGPKFLGKQP